MSELEENIKTLLSLHDGKTTARDFGEWFGVITAGRCLPERELIGRSIFMEISRLKKGGNNG